MNMNLIKIERLIDEATARIYYTKESKIRLLNKCIDMLENERIASPEYNQKIDILIGIAMNKIKEVEKGEMK